MAHTTRLAYGGDPGHQPFHPHHPPDLQICRYCIQPMSTPHCTPEPGNPERPPMNPAVMADIMNGIFPARSLGPIIATAPPDDDPVHYRMTQTLANWLPIPEGWLKPAAQFIADRWTSPEKRAAITELDRVQSIQALYEDGLLIGRSPNKLLYIPGRFLVAAQIGADRRSVTVTYGTRPTETLRLRPSWRGPQLASALNSYANHETDHQELHPR